MKLWLNGNVLYSVANIAQPKPQQTFCTTESEARLVSAASAYVDLASRPKR